MNAPEGVRRLSSMHSGNGRQRSASLIKSGSPVSAVMVRSEPSEWYDQ